MDLFSGLAVPPPGVLTAYFFGPGFGESAVLHMPDGRWVVIDCCVEDGVCLPAALLDQLGAQKIDLLILAHPDLDHVRGVELLLDGRDAGLLVHRADTAVSAARARAVSPRRSRGERSDPEVEQRVDRPLDRRWAA
jgi:glyoxylase-like metal-dependent hydrolase (beta-lactamase superfamily II)